MTQNGTPLIVEGPLGKGLEITPGLSGTQVIFCGGTGILPFVDFLELLFFKIAYEHIKKKNPEAAGHLASFLGVELDKIFKKDLLVQFHGAFRGETETYGLELLKRLARWG